MSGNMVGWIGAGRKPEMKGARYGTRVEQSSFGGQLVAPRSRRDASLRSRISQGGRLRSALCNAARCNHRIMMIMLPVDILSFAA